MQPHQERVVAEERELDSKIEKLHVFIEDSPTFTGLPKTEQDRLRRQKFAMQIYRDILRERIAAFE
jgi:hypothetical protein